MKHHDPAPSRLIEANDEHTVNAKLGYSIRSGRPKGYPIELVRGHRSMTSPLPGMEIMTNVHGVPVADAPDPMDPTIAGKHEAPVMVHPSMTPAQVAGACLNGEDILREAMDGKGRHGLPLKTSED